MGDFGISIAPGADPALARAIQRKMDEAAAEGRYSPGPGDRPRMCDGSSYEAFLAQHPSWEPEEDSFDTFLAQAQPSSEQEHRPPAEAHQCKICECPASEATVPSFSSTFTGLRDGLCCLCFDISNAKPGQHTASGQDIGAWQQDRLQSAVRAEHRNRAELLRRPAVLHAEGMALKRRADSADVSQQLDACALLFEAEQIDCTYGGEFPDLGLQFPSEEMREANSEAHIAFIKEGGTQYIEEYIRMMRTVNVRLGLEEPEDGLGDEDMIPAWHEQQRQQAVDLGPLVGHRVELFGLSGRQDLNGSVGVAAAFSAERGRYTVAIDGTGEKVRIKPANLQAFDGAEPEPAAGPAAVEAAPRAAFAGGAGDGAGAALTEAEFEMVMTLKAKGNASFKRADWVAASTHYAAALAVYGARPGSRPAQRVEKMNLHSNSAESLIRRELHHDAVEEATSALAIDASNAKALLRRARALAGMGDLPGDMDSVALGLRDLKSLKEGGEWSKAANQVAKRLKAQSAFDAKEKAFASGSGAPGLSSSAAGVAPRPHAAWAAGLSPPDLYEWFANCYQMRCDDEYVMSGDLRGPYNPDADGLGIATDYLEFCFLAARNRVVPAGWNWPACLQVSARFVRYAFEKSDAKERWGGENVFAAAMGGRSLRNTAMQVYGCGPECGAFEEETEQRTVARDHAAAWAEAYDVYCEGIDEVGGAQAWESLLGALGGRRREY